MIKRELMIISIFLLFVLSLGMVQASEDLSDDMADGISSLAEVDEISDSIVNDDLKDSDSGVDDSDDSMDDSDTNDNDLDDSDDPMDDSDTDDDLPDSSEKTFDDIQKLIDEAPENSTINLNGTYTSSGKAILINKPITIQGLDGTALIANFTGIFNISSKNVVLKDLSFVNSTFKNNVGIYSAYGLTLSGCEFKNNTGSNFTLISLKSGNSTFTNATISNNTFDNILIYVYEKANLDIDNSIFNKNHFAYKSSLGDNGAIIYLEESNRLNILNSTIENNKDSYKNENGDTFENIFVYSSEGGNVKVDNCVFKKNSLPFALSSSNCTINNSKFEQSGVLNAFDVDFFPLISIENSAFNKLTKGLHFTNGYTKINKCNFTNNTCKIIRTDDDSFMPNNMNLTNSNFINNSNILIYISSSNANIVNCKFKDNKLTDNRGIIYLDELGGRTVTIKNDNKTRKFTNTMGTAFDTSLKDYPFLILKNGTLTTSYHSGKYFNFKLIFGVNKKVFDRNFSLTFVIKQGKKTIKKITAKNYKTGFVRIKCYNLPVGTYKMYITVNSNSYEINSHWAEYERIPYDLGVRTIKITKAKTIVKAPKVTHKRGKSKYFKVTVKNKVTKKGVNALKVKLRIYTGKKYKTYTVKTNKNGVAKFNTKKLKRGKHKVVLLSGNKYFIVSGKTSIKIK